MDQDGLFASGRYIGLAGDALRKKSAELKVHNYLSVGGIRGRPPASLGGDMRSFEIGDRGLRVSILRRCSDAADGSRRIFFR
jgi:hypothetical protein